MSNPDASNRLFGLWKAALALLLAGLYGFYLDDRSYVGVLLVPLFLSASLPFVATSAAIGLVGLWAFPLSVEAGITASVLDAFLIAEAVLAALFMRRRRLVSPELRAYGTRPQGQKWLARYALALWTVAGLLIVSMMFRAIPARVHVALAVLTMLIGWGLSPATKLFTQSWSSYAKNAALFVASVFFSIAVLEIGARVLIFPDSLNETYSKPHPEYLYTLLPGADVRRSFKANDGSRSYINVSISSQGIRDREYTAKEPDEFRIALLGDSFTFGSTVETEHTLSHLLEDDLRGAELPFRVSVYNLGIGATGPWQQRGFLRDTGLALKPDLVVHQLFLGNDVCDTLHQSGEHLQAYNRDQAFVVARWQNSWQDMAYRYRRFRVDAYLQTHSKLYTAIRDSVGALNMYEFLLRGMRILKPIELTAFPVPAPRRQTIEVNLAEWYPELTRGWEQMLGDIESVREMCKENEIDYMAYAIPVQFDVVDEHWDDLMSQYPGWRYDQGRGVQKLQRDLAARGIQTIDAISGLRAHDDRKQLYYHLNGHLTPTGNGVVSAIIADALQQEYFPGRSPG